MTAPKKTSDRFKHAAHAAWRKVGDETIILDLNSSVYYSLNETGSFVWEQLGNGEALPDVAEALTDEFEISADKAEKDAAELVDSLVKEKLLVAA